jgi:hypothetical protein
MRRWAIPALTVWLLRTGMGQTPMETAVVQVQVNRAYDDSEASLRTIETIAQYAPSRRIRVVAGDKLAELIVRTYGFGASDLPKSYALLEKTILEKNNLKRAEELRPGTLNVPAIPTWAHKEYGRENPYNYIANTTLWAAETARPAAASANRNPVREDGVIAASAAAEIAFAQPVALSLNRPNAPFELMKFELPVKAAEEMAASGTGNLVSHSMAVKLAAESACDTTATERNNATLTTEQRTAIAGLLAGQSRRSPIVFVLDTGWPSYEAYKESHEAFYEVLEEVWRDRFEMSIPKPPRAASVRDANHGHCRCIERALRELRDLDRNLEPGKRIRVAYLPLTREQEASRVLTDLLQTSEMLQRQTRSNGRMTPTMREESRVWARQFVSKYFPAKWEGEEVKTDKAILDAILAVLRIYAQSRQTVFFANQSWTVEHDGKYKVYYEAPEFGIVTSAAGNDRSTKLQDFAQRSLSTHDTMAIMSMTASEVAADSTLILEQDIHRALATGFDGRLDGDIHGTSFAAPRVAWFLAAGEAVRSAPLDLERWAFDLKDQIMRIRNPEAAGFLKLWFDPVKYLESAARVPRTSVGGRAPAIK